MRFPSAHRCSVSPGTTASGRLERAVSLPEHVRPELQEQTAHDQAHDQRVRRAAQVPVSVLRQVFYPQTDVKSSPGTGAQQFRRGRSPREPPETFELDRRQLTT